MYFTQFAVTGRGMFPMDMLRYDACFPSTGGDAHNIGIDDRTFRTVRVTRFHAARYWGPTVGRWSSFGWSVDPESIVTDKSGSS